VAFALDRPVLFEMPLPPAGAFTAVDLDPRWDDEVSLRMFRVNPVNPYDRRQSMSDFLGARYRVYSQQPGHLAKRAPAPAQLPREVLDKYLRVPTSFTDRVATLARQITDGQHTPVAKVQSVVKWLQRTHGYTTNLKRDERIADPLEDFLFEQKAGHCEYFASAAAMLLRMSGVPTRYVNGFLGGEWNDLRKGVTVRENRAHSWIEAYLGQEGWVRVDATPSTARATRMGTFRQFLDAAELFWGRWVVEYSASQQLLLAQRLSRGLGLSGRGYISGRDRTRLTRKQALAGTTLIMFVILAVSQRKRLWPWRSRNQGADPGAREKQPIFRLYQATLRRLADAGMPRRPSETPHEYLTRLEDARPLGWDTLARLTDLYTSARYGEVEIPPHIVAEVRQASVGISAQSQ
jgi:transglutaminase-like putative cysteine protease